LQAMFGDGERQERGKLDPQFEAGGSAKNDEL